VIEINLGLCQVQIQDVLLSNCFQISTDSSCRLSHYGDVNMERKKKELPMLDGRGNCACICSRSLIARKSVLMVRGRALEILFRTSIFVFVAVQGFLGFKTIKSAARKRNSSLTAL
jgi:hypothetical protein